MSLHALPRAAKSALRIEGAIMARGGMMMVLVGKLDRERSK